MADQRTQLHIIEPTLVNDAGHCHSFIAALCNKAKGARFDLWVDHAARLPALEQQVVLHRYFWRSMRRFQAFWLYRRLLREPGRIFISTAGRMDLLLMDMAAKGSIPPGKVFFYFHWLNLNEAKKGQLAHIARQQPDINLLAPTTTIVELLRSCGFAKVLLVPYPITPQPAVKTGGGEFRRLLFAGAARGDKGIAHVVALVEALARDKSEIPVLIQSSPDHYNKYDGVTRDALGRLKHIDYPHLSLAPETLPADAYQELFVGAICLQLYERRDFADRISGITLDALSNGTPVLTLSGTWMAGVVERFVAGKVVGEPSTDLLLDAIRAIMADYPGYCRNAMTAGKTLQSENSASHLCEVLMS